MFSKNGEKEFDPVLRMREADIIVPQVCFVHGRMQWFQKPDGPQEQGYKIDVGFNGGAVSVMYAGEGEGKTWHEHLLEQVRGWYERGG